MTDGWQSIDTAPRDGSEFDGWGYIIPDDALTPIDLKFRRLTECYWGRRDSDYVRRSPLPHRGSEGWCSEGHDGWSWAAVLTHWMPVPAAPSGT